MSKPSTFREPDIILTFYVISGPYEGRYKKMRLYMDRLTFLIGRGLKKTDFSLDLDTTVSIKHARISINMNESVPKVQVCDLKSTNGTFLNSVQLESNVCVDICKNDVLQVGSTVILLKEIDNRHLKTDKDLVLGSQNDEFQKETNDNKPVKVKNEHKRNLNLCDSNLIESKRRKNENFHGDVTSTPLKMKKTLCPICSKDITHLQYSSREVHVNHCLQRTTNTVSETNTTEVSEAKNKKTSNIIQTTSVGTSGTNQNTKKIVLEMNLEEIKHMELKDMKQYITRLTGYLTKLEMFVEKCKYIYNQQVQASLTTVALTHESTPSLLPTDSVPCVDEQSRKSQILHEMFEDSALSASFASDSNDSLLSPPASKRVTTSSIEASSLLPSTMMREGRFTDTQSPSKLLFTQHGRFSTDPDESDSESNSFFQEDVSTTTVQTADNPRSSVLSLKRISNISVDAELFIDRSKTAKQYIQNAPEEAMKATFGEHWKQDFSEMSTFTVPNLQIAEENMTQTFHENITNPLQIKAYGYTLTYIKALIEETSSDSTLNKKEKDKNNQSILISSFFEEPESNPLKSPQKSGQTKTIPALSPSKAPKEKKFWTKEEDDALLKGYEQYKHSETKWKAIKEDVVFGKVLLNRTVVNLKDRYRLLAKKDTTKSP